MYKAILFPFALLAATLTGCATLDDELAADQDAFDTAADDAGMQAEASEKAATVNLIVTGATSTSHCSGGLCSVEFLVAVKNTGTTTAFGAAAGGYWTSAAGNVASCSSSGGSTWKAIGTTSANITAGSTGNIIVYGPGYVGSKLAPGTVFSVKFGADPCNSQLETIETDNTKNVNITV